MALPYNYLYNPNYQPNYQQNYQQFTNGLVHVQSESIARNYPVAPGNSVTFINDTAPFCYIKTVGYMPTDAPDFRIYKRIDDVPTEAPTAPTQPHNQDPADTVGESIKAELAALRSRIEALENKSRPASRKETKNEPTEH